MRTLLVQITDWNDRSPQAVIADPEADFALLVRSVAGEWEALHQIRFGPNAEPFICELPSCFALDQELAATLKAELGARIERIYQEARGWISDCEWRNLDQDMIEELSNTEVRIGVEHHYEGGWTAFVEAVDV